MNLKMKNKNYLLYLVTFYFGLLLLLFVFITERNKPFEDGLAAAVFYGGYLAFIGGILFELKEVPVSLAITKNEIMYRKWVYVFIKNERINLDEVERIDVETYLMSGARLALFLKNGRKKRINLFYFILKSMRVKLILFHLGSMHLIIRNYF